MNDTLYAMNWCTRCEVAWTEQAGTRCWCCRRRYSVRAGLGTLLAAGLGLILQKNGRWVTPE